MGTLLFASQTPLHNFFDNVLCHAPLTRHLCDRLVWGHGGGTSPVLSGVITSSSRRSFAPVLVSSSAEQNTNGSSRALGSSLGRSLIVHPAANGYLVVTLRKLKAARKGTGHPTSLRRRLRISVLSKRYPPPNVRNRIWD